MLEDDGGHAYHGFVWLERVSRQKMVAGSNLGGLDALVCAAVI